MSIGVDFGIVGQTVFGPFGSSSISYGVYDFGSGANVTTFGPFNAANASSFGPNDYQTSVSIPDFVIWDNLGGTARYFQMQGWYAAGQVYENWIVVGTPTNNPPSGHILQDVRIAASWTA
jgi:hypothetical protein